MLAIDLGSSWCKAAYIDRQGTIVSEGRVFTREIPAVREGMLGRFWDVVVSAVQQAACDRHSAAIGISCRGLFGVCLDSAGHGFVPSWDFNALKTLAEVSGAYADPIWGERDPYAYGYALRLAGLLIWLRRNKPDEWREIHRVGALHDYIVYQLSGRWMTDPTTGPEHDRWPDEMLELSGLPREAFPIVAAPESVAGGLTACAAEALGLASGTPVVVGLHDGAAANIGAGAVRQHDACFTLGTNFVLRAVTGQRLTSKCFGYSVGYGQWAWVNNVPRASTQLDSVATALGDDGDDLAALHGRLGALAAEVPVGSVGLRMTAMPAGDEPKLTQAVLAARERGYSDGAIYRSMLEAIAIGVRELVEQARRDGANPQRYVATGGGARNRQFVRVLSAALDEPIEVGHPEAGMIGAGMAAAVGAGWFATLDAAMQALAVPGSTVRPDPSEAERYRRWRETGGSGQ